MNFDTSFDRTGEKRRRDPRGAFVAALAAVIAIVLVVGYVYAHRPLGNGTYRVPADAIYRYPAALDGPTMATRMSEPTPTPWRIYQTGANSRLAIYLTNTHSEWLGLAHGLKAIGIPFIITNDITQALAHRVVVAYPLVSGTVISPDSAQRIETFVREGGTFVGFNVVDNTLAPLFEVSPGAPSSARTTVAFDADAANAYGFSVPQERSIRFADLTDASLNMGSYGYRLDGATSIARFNDGTSAITQARTGNGSAYAIGLDLGAFLLKGYNNREQHISNRYVNTYEPSLDVFLRFLKHVYREGEPAAVTLGTVPQAKRFSAIIAHDVDSAVAIGLCLPYARDEERLGVKTTYFIQTKYIRDYNDTAFYTDDARAMTATLQRMGMEVASHSVSHSRDFASFPAGDGTENYPNYLPFILDPQRTYNGTILGELRVSKFLLERTIGAPVVSFRPGNLANPFSLPEHLAQTGYRFTSATTANDSLTHLPFQLNAGRDISAEVPVFEIPITIEDEEAPRMDRREDAAERVAEDIARYGGVVSVLIHPSITGYKMAFEDWFVRRFNREASFVTYRDFGTWWAARNAVSVDTRRTPHGISVALRATAPIAGLPLEVPAGYRAAGPLVASQRGTVVVLRRFSGTATLSLVGR